MIYRLIRPVKEIDNALAPAHLCALFGGVGETQFSQKPYGELTWQLKSPPFLIGYTSSQVPFSVTLLVLLEGIFWWQKTHGGKGILTLPSKDEGWGEIIYFHEIKTS